MSFLEVALDPSRVIVAVDPGKVSNRVWVSDGSGLLTDPVSLPVAREGISLLERLLEDHAAIDPVIAVEATGSLHWSWVAEMERRRPGCVRLFAPSQTKAARMQLGSSQICQCRAISIVSLEPARQGAGRLHVEESALGALRAAVRHRRSLVADRRVAQQRMHDQLNALCPGLSGGAGDAHTLELIDVKRSTAISCSSTCSAASWDPQMRVLALPARHRLLVGRCAGRRDVGTSCNPVSLYVIGASRA
jgi:transposase